MGAIPIIVQQSQQLQPISYSPVQQPQVIYSTNNDNFSFPKLVLPSIGNSVCLSNNASQMRNTGNGSPLYTICEQETKMDPSATPYVPASPSPSPSDLSVQSMNLNIHNATFVKQYFPAFAARAELNIFIPSTLTQTICKL